jgi:hypothetical protein
MRFCLVAFSALTVLSSAGAIAADNSSPPLDSVTVEAQRQHATLVKQVDSFVEGAMVHYSDQSLARWNKPVCPLVAGLPRDQGEFMLALLSRIAADAGIKLGAEKCTANLFVIVTREPELLLKKWRERDARLFDDRNGLVAIRRFLNTARPIRVWYNTGRRDLNFESVAGGIGNLNKLNINSASNPGANSRMTLGDNDLYSISSVIIVVDSTRVKNLTFGQFADYLGMIGFAQLRPDSDIGSAPSILHLFAKSQAPPPALSSWDKALLKSLYATSPGDSMQLLKINRSVLESIQTPGAANAASPY